MVGVDEFPPQRGQASTPEWTSTLPGCVLDMLRDMEREGALWWLAGSLPATNGAQLVLQVGGPIRAAARRTAKLLVACLKAVRSQIQPVYLLFTTRCLLW